VPAAGVAVRAPGAEVVEVPSADPSWNPVAVRWYESLAMSGQSKFYEPSDWATAFAVAESMSREFEPQPIVIGTGKDATVQMHRVAPKAASVAAWLKAASQLMATEGDRRRMALELERPAPDGDEEGGDVTHLDDVRGRLRSTS
jgi:hypothetical protein